MSQSKQFNENFHGILTHDGWIKVAKFNITAKILNIQSNSKIQVRGNTGKGSYLCDVHKNLRKDIKFMGKDDLVGIKWNMGNPYIVGYRKATAEDVVNNPSGDCPVHDNGRTDWITFFKRIDAE